MEKEVRDQPAGSPTLVGSKFTVDNIMRSAQHFDVLGIMRMFTDEHKR